MIGAVAALLATPAFAHTGHGASGGFAHPFTGSDHLLAMVAVGLWAGLALKRAWFVWPAAFAGFMLLGFGWATAGGAFPAAETVILASVVALGLAAGFDLKLPTVAGAAAVALFGAAHGYAHGLEHSGDAVSFAAGFVVATIMLHLAGLGLAAALLKIKGRFLVRAAGFGVAAAGLVLAVAA